MIALNVVVQMMARATQWAQVSGLAMHKDVVKYFYW